MNVIENAAQRRPTAASGLRDCALGLGLMLLMALAAAEGGLPPLMLLSAARRAIR